jgi:hypothetical protein
MTQMLIEEACSNLLLGLACQALLQFIVYYMRLPILEQVVSCLKQMKYTRQEIRQTISISDNIT